MIGDRQQRELLNRLAGQGWEVISRQRSDLEWWAAEVWTVESVWSPHGFRVYLTFLVDPQSSSGEVWAVDASLEWPANGPMGSRLARIGRSTWPQDLPEFWLRCLTFARGRQGEQTVTNRPACCKTPTAN